MQAINVAQQVLIDEDPWTPRTEPQREPSEDPWAGEPVYVLPEDPWTPRTEPQREPSEDPWAGEPVQVIDMGHIGSFWPGLDELVDTLVAEYHALEDELAARAVDEDLWVMASVDALEYELRVQGRDEDPWAVEPVNWARFWRAVNDMKKN